MLGLCHGDDDADCSRDDFESWEYCNLTNSWEGCECRLAHCLLSLSRFVEVELEQLFNIIAVFQKTLRSHHSPITMGFLSTLKISDIKHCLALDPRYFHNSLSIVSFYSCMYIQLVSYTVDLLVLGLLIFTWIGLDISLQCIKYVCIYQVIERTV